eukprot:tig00020660_g12570.t1
MPAMSSALFAEVPALDFEDASTSVARPPRPPQPPPPPPSLDRMQGAGDPSQSHADLEDSEGDSTSFERAAQRAALQCAHARSWETSSAETERSRSRRASDAAAAAYSPRSESNCRAHAVHASYRSLLLSIASSIEVKHDRWSLQFADKDLERRFRRFVGEQRLPLQRMVARSIIVLMAGLLFVPFLFKADDGVDPASQTVAAANTLAFLFVVTGIEQLTDARFFREARTPTRPGPTPPPPLPPPLPAFLKHLSATLLPRTTCTPPAPPPATSSPQGESPPPYPSFSSPTRLFRFLFRRRDLYFGMCLVGFFLVFNLSFAVYLSASSPCGDPKTRLLPATFSPPCILTLWVQAMVGSAPIHLNALWARPTNPLRPPALAIHVLEILGLKFDPDQSVFMVVAFGAMFGPCAPSLVGTLRAVASIVGALAISVYTAHRRETESRFLFLVFERARRAARHGLGPARAPPLNAGALPMSTELSSPTHVASPSTSVPLSPALYGLGAGGDREDDGERAPSPLPPPRSYRSPAAPLSLRKSSDPAAVARPPRSGSLSGLETWVPVVPAPPTLDLLPEISIEAAPPTPRRGDIERSRSSSPPVSNCNCNGAGAASPTGGAGGSGSCDARFAYVFAAPSSNYNSSGNCNSGSRSPCSSSALSPLGLSSLLVANRSLIARNAYGSSSPSPRPRHGSTSSTVYPDTSDEEGEGGGRSTPGAAGARGILPRLGSTDSIPLSASGVELLGAGPQPASRRGSVAGSVEGADNVDDVAGDRDAVGIDGRADADDGVSFSLKFRSPVAESLYQNWFVARNARRMQWQAIVGVVAYALAVVLTNRHERDPGGPYASSRLALAIEGAAAAALLALVALSFAGRRFYEAHYHPYMGAGLLLAQIAFVLVSHMYPLSETEVFMSHLGVIMNGLLATATFRLRFWCCLALSIALFSTYFLVSALWAPSIIPVLWVEFVGARRQGRH